mmetsp:Transcript_20819/g.19860  ORF Transcript_20819/g.19860 Transcript_20819/m.19860 type:complete len:120 (+) Transcript_20819:34-393(+)
MVFFVRFVPKRICLLSIILSVATCQDFKVHHQNLFVQSGINIAVSQEVLNKFVPILKNVTTYLSNYTLDLYYPNVIRFTQFNELDGELIELANISISHLNFPVLSFEVDQSSFTIMESS